MGLSIFAFDLAALINSLSNIIQTSDEIPDNIQMPEVSLDSTTEVLAATAEMTDAIIEDILLATTINNAALSITLADEVQKKESSKPKISNSERVISQTTGSTDDEYRKAIEQLIRSLQISVVHSYQSADIINEKVSFDNVANFPKKQILTDREKKPDKLEEDKKRQDIKLRELREELRKAMLRNNSNYL